MEDIRDRIAPEIRDTIKHVFVLMLENRSFDHMLGYSGIGGNDASGSPQLDGLLDGQGNKRTGVDKRVSKPARDPMAVDPGHDFKNVLRQLCGDNVTYPDSYGRYPAIKNNGYAEDYEQMRMFRNWRLGLRQIFVRRPTPEDVFRCLAPTQCPSLLGLAQEFAVCDRWFSSMPGPTWPNRFFAVAGTSGGLDHDRGARQATYDNIRHGYKLSSIFTSNIRWRIYAGHKLITFAHALEGVTKDRILRYRDFPDDVGSSGYDAQFTWIEPSYGNVASDFVLGSSQHPLDKIARGDKLIKKTYEAIRGSRSIWPSSLLIVTWDEHGGFYDHAVPPPAQAPGDGPYPADINKKKFDFTQYGPRVPAVIVSAHTPPGIDHTVYDHSSIVTTVEELFGPLNGPHRRGASVLGLVSKRDRDAPDRLPPYANAGTDARSLDTLDRPFASATRPWQRLDEKENDAIAQVLYLAARMHMQLVPSSEHEQVFRRLNEIETRRQARDYLEEVRQRLVSGAAPDGGAPTSDSKLLGTIGTTLTTLSALMRVLSRARRAKRVIL